MDKNLLNKIIPPCHRCMYKLGTVKTLVNPCNECKLNNYNMYEVFTNKLDNKK